MSVGMGDYSIGEACLVSSVSAQSRARKGSWPLSALPCWVSPTGPQRPYREGSRVRSQSPQQAAHPPMGSTPAVLPAREGDLGSMLCALLHHSCSCLLQVAAGARVCCWGQETTDLSPCSHSPGSWGNPLAELGGRGRVLWAEIKGHQQGQGAVVGE